MNFKDIKFLREVNNLTQEQLAEKLGISRCSVTKWETGKGNPKLKHIIMLCEIFDCPIEFFFDKQSEEEKKKK